MGFVDTIQNHRFRLFLHAAQCILILGAIILTIMIINGATYPIARSQIMIMGFGFKSYIFIAYQLLTEYNSRFKRWASLKANFILNTIDVVFWFAAVVLTFMSITKRCEGTTCTYTWLVAILSMVIAPTFAIASYASWIEWRAAKYGARHTNKYYSGQV